MKAFNSEQLQFLCFISFPVSVNGSAVNGNSRRRGSEGAAREVKMSAPKTIPKDAQVRNELFFIYCTV